MTLLTGMNSNNSGAGPVFRVNPNNTNRLYQMDINEKGDWDVASASETNSSSPVSKTNACQNPCPYVHTGLNQANVITIRAFGSQVQIQVNGQPLVSFTDKTYASGFIGVQMSPGTANSSVAFSHVRIWQL